MVLFETQNIDHFGPLNFKFLKFASQKYKSKYAEMVFLAF